LAGQPLVVALELSREGDVIEVQGRLAGSEKPWTWRIDVPPLSAPVRGATTVPLGALYGRETIADLEMRGVRSDERVLAVALRHRIASRATSLVAVSEEPSVDPKAPRRRITLPVEMPGTMSAEAVGLGSGMELHMRLRAEGSARALRVSGGVSEMLLGASLGERGHGLRGIKARVLAVEGDRLVVEYEAPSQGFLGPEGKIAVMMDGRDVATGTIDPASSSPRGPHAKGLLLRLAIVGDSSWTCRVGDEITIVEGALA
jgi:hypothetical protein